MAAHWRAPEKKAAQEIPASNKKGNEWEFIKMIVKIL
jgi:hypothetical protein